MSEVLENEKKPNAVKSLFSDLPRAFRAFLAPYIACFLIVANVVMDTHELISAENPFGDFVAYPALILLLGLYLMLAALFANGKTRTVWRVLGYIGGAAVSIAVLLVSVWMDRTDSPLSTYFNVSVLLLAACAALTMLPLLCRDREQFPRYVIRVLLHGMLCGILTSVVMSGVLLLFGTLEALFDGDVMLYFLDVPAVLYGLGWPLLLMPALFPKEEERDYHKALWAFFVYALLPILALLTLIFCVYLLRILARWTWPVNAVSPLVTVGAVLLLFGLLFLAGRKESRIYKLYARWFTLIWLLPLSMFFAGVGIRILNYGLTPLRIYLLVFGAFVLISILLAVLSPKKYSPRFSMLLLAGMLLVITFCPYGNAFTLSRLDQTARLDRALADAGMGNHLSVTPNPDAADAQRRAVCDAADYLMEYTTVPVGDLRDKDVSYDDVFGFGSGYWYEEEETPREYLSAWTDPEYTLTDTTGTRLAYHAVIYDWSDETFELDDWTVTTADFTVTVSDGTDAAAFDLAAAAEQALLAYETGAEDWSTVRLTSDSMSARAVFSEADGYRENDVITISSLNCMLLIEE